MRYFVVHFEQKSCYLCAYHISKTNFIRQPHGQKTYKSQAQCSSTLCGCLYTWPIWCCPMEPFHMRYSVVHFVWKSCYFVCATAVKLILFLNHMNRKMVGDKHNILVHYVDVSAPESSGIVLCNPVRWNILWFILIKKLVILCVEQQQNVFFPQPQE